jgi:hypothetical protein
MQRTLLTLALIATAGVSYAQTMPASEPTDPYGRPMIGRNDWVRQPGDRPGPSGGMQSGGMQSGAAVNYGGNMATAPAAQPMATAPMAQPSIAQPRASGTNKLERGHATGPEPVPMDAVGPRQTAFRDEYGFRYDSQGNRLDARGNIISPHTPQR